MDASSLKPGAPLPDDVATLQDLVRQLLADVERQRTENAQLRAENAQLQGEIAQLRARLDEALKHRFGQRSERTPRPKRDADKPPRNRNEHGRGPLPEHLERREVIHDLTEAEKLCPCCGKPRVCIGSHATEQLDMEPARVFVRRTVRKTYACQECDPDEVPVEQRFQTAGPPEVGPIARGLCGAGLLASLIVAKFSDHTPVHRFANQVKRSGVRIAESTLGGWLASAAVLFDPLWHLMHKRVLLSRVIHDDDTTVKLRVAEAKKTARSHLWAAIGDADHPYVVFDFSVDYSNDGPKDFFTGYQGYLQADALAQYEVLFSDGKIKHVCCWAHARRKFVAAADGGDERAKEAVELIRKLYAIERELPPLLPPSELPLEQEQRRQREAERRAIRQRDAKPVLAELKKWLDGHKGKVLPKSPLGQAISYALNNWEALSRYVEEGYLAIDNNLSERTLRSIALGRNNWGVLGSETGGRTAAVLYTMAGTCKHLGIDPFVYLKEALMGLFSLGEKPTDEQLLAWLPDVWLQRRSSEARAGPAAG
jgi:transposase